MVQNGSVAIMRSLIKKHKRTEKNQVFKFLFRSKLTTELMKDLMGPREPYAESAWVLENSLPLLNILGAGALESAREMEACWLLLFSKIPPS